MSDNYVKPTGSQLGGKTRHLYVCGLGAALNTPISDIISIFEKFGKLDYSLAWGPVECPADKRFCFVSFVDESASVAAFTAMHEQPIQAFNVSRLLIRYACLQPEFPGKKKGPPEPECTSLTEDVNVPGLYYVEDFISVEEEAELLQYFDNQESLWEYGLSRRVQHFGIPFNYRTLMLDYNREIASIPTLCEPITERMINYANSVRGGDNGEGTEGEKSTSPEIKLSLEQLTVNEYEPGQGIAPHVDTFSCFGPEIFIISLGSGIVMNFTKHISEKDYTHGENKMHDGIEGDEGTSGVKSGNRKYLFLKPRSLVLFTGESRYQWSHAIASRFRDKVNGDMLSRERRVSLTFRQALEPFSDIKELSASYTEKDHVFRVYDNIAVHWNHTRGRRKVHWNRVKTFLEELPPGTLLADIGSGDGKYFGLNDGVTCIGCDRSWNLLQVSKEPEHETFCCDIVKLPIVDDSFDATICIAVMHHLASKARRIAAIRELLRITRPDGYIMIQAWALEQETNSRMNFEEQDVLVPWKLQQRFFSESHIKIAGEEFLETSNAKEVESPEGPCEHVKVDDKGSLVYQRYCHVYREGELEDLCSGIPGACVEESGWDKGNWFVKIRKDSSNKWVENKLSANPRSFTPSNFVKRISMSNSSSSRKETDGESKLTIVEPNNRSKTK